MINVYVGSGAEYAEVEPVMEGCLREHTDEKVSITFMRAGEHGLRPSGCTGFTMYRYAVPHLMGREGFAIYLDVDMFLMADIAELWEYRARGKWAVLKDGSTEVIVMDCAAASTPTARTVHKLQKGQVRIPAYPCIPAAWNHEDRLYKNTKLLHFTDIDRQPWRQDGHPLQDVWEELKARHG